MAEPVSTEVIARGLIKEAPASADATVKAQVDILKKELKTKGAHATLEMAAGKKLDVQMVDRVIDENIGTKRNPDGTKDRPALSEELTRKTDIDSYRALWVDYTQKGYDQLTVPQQNDLVSRYLDSVRTIPAFKERIDGFATALDRRHYAERILRDPKLAKEVELLLIGQAGDTSKILSENVSVLDAEFKTIDEQYTKITDRIKEIDRSLTKIDTSLKEYKADKGGRGHAVGQTYQRILDLEGDVAVKETSIAPKVKALKTNQLTMEKLENEKQKSIKGIGIAGAGPRDVDDITLEITSCQAEIDRLSGELAPDLKEIKQNQDIVEQLRQQETALTEERKTLETEKKDLVDQEKNVGKERTTKEVILAKAKAARRVDEEKFVSDFKGIFDKAVGKYLEEEISTAETTARDALENQAKESKSEAEKDILERLSSRYFSGKKLNIDLVRMEKDQLVNNNNPDVLIRTILREVQDGAGHTKYTPAQIDEIMKNPEFVTGMRQKVGETVLKYYFLKGGLFQRGGKLSTDEILKIRDSEWGKQVITNAITEKNSVQTEIEKNIGEKVVNERGKLGEWLKKIDLKKLLLILVIIFGLTGALGALAAKG